MKRSNVIAKTTISYYSWDFFFFVFFFFPFFYILVNKFIYDKTFKYKIILFLCKLIKVNNKCMLYL